MLNGKLSQMKEREGGNVTHGSVLPPNASFRAGVSTMRPRRCGAVRSLGKWPVTFRTGIVRQTRDVSAPSGFNYFVHIWNIKALKNIDIYLAS